MATPLHTLYTAGYSGIKPDDLLRVARHFDAIVADVRFSPASRNPNWRKASLQAMLQERYRHIGDLGNINYKGQHGKGIILANVDSGANVVVKLLAKQPVILLCACKNVQTCHRLTAAQEIQNRYAVEVQHLTLEDMKTLGFPPGFQVTQPSLF